MASYPEVKGSNEIIIEGSSVVQNNSRGELWTTKQAADFIKIEPETLTGWRRREYGPRGFPVGRELRWWEADVRAWVAEQEANVTNR